MIKKIFFSALSIVLISLFAVGASSSAYSQSSSQNLTSGSSQAVKDSNVLATVNNKKIYKSDLEESLKAYRAAVSVQSNSVNEISDAKVQQNVKETVPALKSNRQLLENLIKVQVITDDCEKNGIRVSNEEAKSTMEKNLKIFQDLIQNGTDLEKKQAQEAWNSYNAIAKAMGLTLDEYNEKCGVIATKTILIENRHYQHFVSDLDQKNLTQDKIHKLYDQYVQKLIQENNVTINDIVLNSIE